MKLQIIILNNKHKKKVDNFIHIDKLCKCITVLLKYTAIMHSILN